MRAKDLMSTEVVTVSPETPMAALARLLADRGISAVPVVEADGKVAGIVTEADLVRRLAGTEERPRGWFRNLLASAPGDAGRYARAHGTTVRDVMTTNLISAGEEATAEEIARLMEEHRVKRVLVLREGRLVGIVSRADLLEAMLAPSETPAAGAEDARIRRAVQAAMAEQSWAKPYFIWPTVERGVVTFHGFCGAPEVTRALRVLAEAVPGAQGVEMRIEAPPPSLFGAE
ncbi:CBS domain-containing protein [Roseicella aquatilis]|uniref:CBS domain-containing protein n=2 Tax=Roseicella aquatilis TaxID=2527868 RepID=A0A4R4D3U3_9PROT|nr:CBS domain-containing protein [Roseicella aquatilis]